ncbi:CaiB/BaiF CoA transferase family protein [Falsiroseomonas ponticola]|uniref:CaiB/BaiF CoA transferase family protein n=1 Tax=Falsiroseomonas ponticola TaxID=2786951 RepID=UPI00193182CD|nr:CaiB/BaiF CoA-transferase family protein [Roseomonas ponticola]
MSGPARMLPRVRPDAARQGPLAGIRVVDLSRLVAGNMLSLQLADFGADVIKVEAAGSGDTLRAWREAHADHPGGFDGWWRVYGRNKRSLAIDLRDEDARHWLLRLAGTAQVLVESFRPGTLEAMGLAPGALHAANRGLVIVRLSGWGQTGPYRDLPGFGSLIEGFCGFADKHRQPDGTPGLPNMALADMVTGLTGAFGVMAALREVEVRGGRGQVIDLSLLEPMVAIMGPDVTNAAATGRPPETLKIASPRGAYRCADGGWVSLSGSTDSMARRVFEAIGRPELCEDPRFATNAARLAHDAEIEAMLAGFIGAMDREAALALFRARGVTVGPIHDAASLLRDPHVAARGVYVEEEGAGTVMHAVTPRLSGTPGGLRRTAPRCGEHSAEILAELGARPEEVAALAAKRAVRCG